MKVETEEYFDLEKRKEVIDRARKLRKEYLRYREAEVVYSIQHKKLIELADDAGALYRIDGYVLINRVIFDEYLEQFHQPAGIYKNAGNEHRALEERKGKHDR